MGQMDNFYWHIEQEFLYVVDRPLIILGIALAAMIAVTIGLVIHSRGGSDDA